MKHCRKNSSVSCPHRNEMPNNLNLDCAPPLNSDIRLMLVEAEKEKEKYCTSCTFFEPKG